MARSRNIKPSFFDNEDLAALPPHARLLFIGLWMLSDAHGKLEDRPARIKKQILGYENVDIDALMKNLEDSGFIQRYSVRGQSVVMIPNFVRHQNPHKNEREKGSDLPDPPEENTQVIENKGCPEKSGFIQNNPDKDGTTPEESLLLNPSYGTLNDEPLNPESGTLKPERDTPSATRSASRKKNGATKTTDLWEAYCEAYRARYGVAPVRNAKVNGQLSKLIDRIGASEAPFVAGYYVTSNNSWYVRRGHSVDDLLKDAEKLRTEWATQRQTTSRQASELDRKSKDTEEWQRIIDEIQKEDKANERRNRIN